MYPEHAAEGDVAIYQFTDVVGGGGLSWPSTGSR